MTNGISSQQQNYFTFCNELQSYLKTEIMTNLVKSDMRANPNSFKPNKDEHLKVTIIGSNTAPDYSTGPRVVFIGVNLFVINARHYHNMLRNKWKTPKQLPGTELSQEKYMYDIEKYSAFRQFPDTTWEEEQQGTILFPGESCAWELELATHDTPNIKFCMVGTVSYRHLFQRKILMSIPLVEQNKV